MSLPPDWQAKTEWAYARMRYPGFGRGRGGELCQRPGDVEGRAGQPPEIFVFLGLDGAQLGVTRRDQHLLPLREGSQHLDRRLQRDRRPRARGRNTRRDPERHSAAPAPRATSRCRVQSRCRGASPGTDASGVRRAHSRRGRRARWICAWRRAPIRPQLHGALRRTTSQTPAVRTERHGRDGALMPVEG